MNHRIRNSATILLAAALASPIFAQSGADTYKTRCAMCHGPDGTATTPMAKMMKIPSFKSLEVVKALDASLVDVTKDGKGKMPAYSGKLTDGQIKDAIAYIRTLQKK